MELETSFLKLRKKAPDVMEEAASTMVVTLCTSFLAEEARWAIGYFLASRSIQPEEAVCTEEDLRYWSS